MVCLVGECLASAADIIKRDTHRQELDMCMFS